MIVTAQPNYWTFRESVQRTPEERLLDETMPDIQAKLGIQIYDFRPLIRCGKEVRRGLVAQHYPSQAFTHYLNGKAIHHELERYMLAIAPNNGRVH